MWSKPDRPAPSRPRLRRIAGMFVLALACLIVLPSVMVDSEQDAVRSSPDSRVLSLVFGLSWLASLAVYTTWGIVSVRRGRRRAAGQAGPPSALSRAGHGALAVLTIAVLALLRLAAHVAVLAAPVFGIAAGVVLSVSFFLFYAGWRMIATRRAAREPG